MVKEIIFTSDEFAVKDDNNILDLTKNTVIL